MTNNDLQNTTQKAKDRATRTLIETLICLTNIHSTFSVDNEG